MTQQTKRPNLLPYLLVLLVLVGVYGFMNKPVEAEPSYAEVRELFESEQVSAFTVTDTTLRMKLREPIDGKTELKKDLFSVTLFYDDLGELIEQQKADGIIEDYDFTADHSINYVAMFAPYILAVLGIFAIWYFLSVRSAGGGGGDRMAKFGTASFKTGGDNKRPTTFSDVAGADEEKEELQEIVDFLKAPGKFIDLGARIPKGVLLVGPPGTGKTLLAKAVAGEANVPFFSISGSDFVEMFVGMGASRVRDLFQQAAKVAPCIIFIDEIDAVGRARDNRYGNNSEQEQTLNQLLSEIDGFEPSKGIVCLAATNRPEILDKALLRPGRFDRRIIVDKPNLQGRLDTLKVHTRKIRLSDDVDLRKIAQATAGAVGADLANLVNEAALRAVRKGRQLVNQEDLLVSFETVIAGTEKKNTVLTDMEKRLVAYHEVGHALVAALEKHSQPVSKITIVPHTSGALGYTMQMPEEEKYLSTAEELRTELRTLVGGRAAEQVVFGVQTTGAANDIQRATALARNMVTQYGMSEKVGMIQYGGDENIEQRVFINSEEVFQCFLFKYVCYDQPAAETDEEHINYGRISAERQIKTSDGTKTQEYFVPDSTDPARKVKPKSRQKSPKHTADSDKREVHP